MSRLQYWLTDITNILWPWRNCCHLWFLTNLSCVATAWGDLGLLSRSKVRFAWRYRCIWTATAQGQLHIVFWNVMLSWGVSFTQRYGATYRTTWIFNKTAMIASNVAGTNLPVCQNGMLSVNSHPLLEVTVSCQDSAQRTGARLWAKQGMKWDNNILF